MIGTELSASTLLAATCFMCFSRVMKSTALTLAPKEEVRSLASNDASGGSTPVHGLAERCTAVGDVGWMAAGAGLMLEAEV